MSPVRFALAALVLASMACSGEERPPGTAMLLPDSDAATQADGPWLEGGFQDGPPEPDAAGFCGNTFFDVTPEPPNLYFVLDRSGSMNGTAGATSQSKLTAARVAAIDLVVELGHRANIGAAVFPGSPYVNECSTGREVFPTQPGDPPADYQDGMGPVASAFAASLNVSAEGGTPIAATLSTLLPSLRSLEGNTAVVLMTDGGPNCSLSYACGPDDCIWNIEGAQINGQWCSPTYNCCDSNILYGPGIRGCLDGAATVAAVAALRNAGVRTYVIGMPGSQFYVSLLDQLATVGGSARAGEPRYYRVDDTANLGKTLAAIGMKALLTCDFALDQAPPDPDFVNVYFDQSLVPYDESDGWSWTSDTTLKLNGEACAKLQGGEVAKVQVVAGCPTHQPR